MKGKIPEFLSFAMLESYRLQVPPRPIGVDTEDTSDLGIVRVEMIPPEQRRRLTSNA